MSSPLGVSYFQIEALKRMSEELAPGFRPTRGILFPNYVRLYCNNTCTPFPSPLGVSYFQINHRDLVDIVRDKFPSPLGVSYFPILNTISEHTKENECFRPLSGYLISK